MFKKCSLGSSTISLVTWSKGAWEVDVNYLFWRVWLRSSLVSLSCFFKHLLSESFLSNSKLKASFSLIMSVSLVSSLLIHWVKLLCTLATSSEKELNLESIWVVYVTIRSSLVSIFYKNWFYALTLKVCQFETSLAYDSAFCAPSIDTFLYCTIG